MDCSFLDNETYKEIPLYRMIDNNHGNLPFYIRKYSMKDKATSLHRHEYMQVNYVYRGSGKHFINNFTFDIIKGDIFVIPPYVPHSIHACTDMDIGIVEFEFEPDFINQSFNSIENAEPFLDFAYIEPFLVSEAQIKPRLNLTGRTQLDVEDILEEVLEEYEGKESGYILLVKSLLLKLLVIVGRAFTKNLHNSEPQPVFGHQRNAILGAIKYINENYMEELSADEVARQFMLSPSYFRYLLKSITSKTFTEHIHSIRISRAMEMLKTTDMRVLDISCNIGFNNVNHFNKVFRQQTGVTPLQYRKGNAN
jgi:AraC-like DNA-binding protein